MACSRSSFGRSIDVIAIARTPQRMRESWVPMLRLEVQFDRDLGVRLKSVLVLLLALDLVVQVVMMMVMMITKSRMDGM